MCGGALFLIFFKIFRGNVPEKSELLLIFFDIFWSPQKISGVTRALPFDIFSDVFTHNPKKLFGTPPTNLPYLSTLSSPRIQNSLPVRIKIWSPYLVSIVSRSGAIFSGRGWRLGGQGCKFHFRLGGRFIKKKKIRQHVHMRSKLSH